MTAEPIKRLRTTTALVFIFARLENNSTSATDSKNRWKI